ncbi:uncharacterized protein [Lolium perenne]|uniref:uncharacterized protein isoform X3 n=1 Tax=Lolium perenne TaxID=4522 RepID=UPI0021F5B24D|nr:uncharacterized protein LOC127308247 isoform X4 [Lolium perenne]XP_051194987.1 uncharacterized protein LOC127308247 isoform X4 [Lolium perenne]
MQLAGVAAMPCLRAYENAMRLLLNRSWRRVHRTAPLVVALSRFWLQFSQDKEDDLMADKMEPVLNPEYPETTETCIGSSSFLISISCTMLVRLMDDGWLAARHDLGHCLTAAVACCSRKPPAEDGWQGSCLSNVDQMRRW